MGSRKGRITVSEAPAVTKIPSPPVNVNRKRWSCPQSSHRSVHHTALGLSFLVNRRGEGLEPDDDKWDNPTMIVTLDAKRRLTVPAALAPASPGDYFDARFDAEEDTLVFRRLSGTENWLDVVKACPVSPEDVPPRRRAPARRRKL